MVGAPLCRWCGTQPVKRCASGVRKGQWNTFCGRRCACRANRALQDPLRNAARLRDANTQRSIARVKAALRTVFRDVLHAGEPVSVKEAMRLAIAFGRVRWYHGYRAAWAQRRRQLLEG